MQLPHQLGRERGGELVGHPGGQVAFGVAVGDVAQGAAAARARERGDHEAWELRKKRGIYVISCGAVSIFQ